MQLGQNAASSFLADMPPAQKNVVPDAGGAAGQGSAFADFIARATAAEDSGTVVDADHETPLCAEELLTEDPTCSDDTVEANGLAFTWLLQTSPPLNRFIVAGTVAAGAASTTGAAIEEVVITHESARPDIKTLQQGNWDASVQSLPNLDASAGKIQKVDITPTDHPNLAPALSARKTGLAGISGSGALLQTSAELLNGITVQVAQFGRPRIQVLESAFGVLAARQRVDADQVPAGDFVAQETTTNAPEKAFAFSSGVMTDSQDLQLQLDSAPEATLHRVVTPAMIAQHTSIGHADDPMAIDKDLALVTAVVQTGASAMASVMAEAKATTLNNNPQDAKPSHQDTPHNAKFSQVFPISSKDVHQGNSQPNMTAASLAKANLTKAAFLETNLNDESVPPLGPSFSLGTETAKLAPSAFFAVSDSAKPNLPSVVAQISHHLHLKPAGTIEINLHPKELGKLHFEMIQKGEGMFVTLTAEQPQTVELLRKGAEQLLQELRNAGFVGSTINFDQWGQNPQQQSGQKTPFRATLLEEDVASQIPAPQNAAAASSGRSLDIRL